MQTTITPYSSDAFAEGLMDKRLPWQIQSGGWSDSTKEQYFSMLNSEIANRNELAMWHLNNEYNTPAKQMERMIAAGINPAAAYQNVSSGTSGSAPGVHESKTANWHDTSDNLNKINTIMSGISQVVSSIGNAVGSASGIQDMALKHQNNWWNQMRANYANELLGSVPTIYSSPQGDYTYELYPGAYIDQRIPMFFPELVKGFNSKSYEYELRDALNNRQQGIYDKQMQVNNLLNGIFNNLGSSSPDIGRVFKDVLKLISIQLLNRY